MRCEKSKQPPLTHSHTMTPLTCLEKKPFQSTVVKGENAGNQHFLLFPQCFLLYQRQKLSLMLHLFCRLQMLTIWTRSNFCRLGMGYAKSSCYTDVHIV